VGRVIDEKKLQQVLQLLAGEIAGHKRAARCGIHDTGTERRHGEHIVDRLHARLSSGEASAHIPLAVKPMSASVAALKASVQRLARTVLAAMSVNVLGMKSDGDAISHSPQVSAGTASRPLIKVAGGDEARLRWRKWSGRKRDWQRAWR
jgi:hypothetical protein